MDRTIFTTDPDTGYQARRKAHKPTVGVILRRTGLSSHRRFDAITGTNTTTCTTVYHIFQHVEHLIRSIFRQYFTHLRIEIRNRIAVRILYSGHIQRFDSYAFVGKSRITAYHLTNRDIWSPQTNRNYWIHFVL